MYVKYLNDRDLIDRGFLVTNFTKLIPSTYSKTDISLDNTENIMIHVTSNNNFYNYRIISDVRSTIDRGTATNIQELDKVIYKYFNENDEALPMYKVTKQKSFESTLLDNVGEINYACIKDSKILFYAGGSKTPINFQIDLKNIFTESKIEIITDENSSVLIPTDSSNGIISLKQMILYISKSFPSLIEANLDTICDNLQNFYDKITEGVAYQSERPSIYVENNQVDSIISIFLLEEGVGIKLDFQNKNVFSLIDNKLSIISMDFISNSPLISSLLSEVLMENEVNYYSMLLLNDK